MLPLYTPGHQKEKSLMTTLDRLDPKSTGIRNAPDIAALVEHAVREGVYFPHDPSGNGGVQIRVNRDASAEGHRLADILRERRAEVNAFHAARRPAWPDIPDDGYGPRPAPFDPEKAADEAAWRVCRIPYQTLVALAIYELNTWLSRADAGLLAYEPPLPPRWDDGLVHDDQRERPPQATVPVEQAGARHSFRGGGRRD